MKAEYESIAAYEPEDFLPAIQRLVQDPSFFKVVESVCHSLLADKLPAEQVISVMSQLKNLDELDDKLTFPGLTMLSEHTGKGLLLRGQEHLFDNALFITNHRDIILDAAFLSVMVKEVLEKRFYMGVGTNLYVTPWIEDLVRLHLCFNIIRGGAPRELMAHSNLLSDYIHYLITEKHSSVWIAQREGRAKDSDDRTQPALLKMLTIAGDGTFIERIKALNITPVSLSYEYDPCDWLKAQEMQQKRDNPNYKKTPQDDYINMRTGIFGWKGRIIFTVTPCINNELNAIAAATSVRNEQVVLTAECIDRHIHKNYAIFANNKIAYDLLTDTPRFSADYTSTEKSDFIDYINGQIDKIEIENKDIPFLRSRLVEMYANPLRNQLALEENTSNKQ